MSLYITSDVSTSGTVSIPLQSYSAKFDVTANQVTIVDIPQSASMKDYGTYDSGIHIESDKSVVVYAHIYDSSVSGATLVLPTPTLGKDYYSINYKQLSNEVNSYSYFFVVAVEDNTEIEITPSVDTRGGLKANVPVKKTLKKGQIYQDLGTTTSSSNGAVYGGDLTGTRIRSVSSTAESCKRIAVFSGSGKITIGNVYTASVTNVQAVGSADNLYQQVYPTATWGKRFVSIPLKGRNYDAFRIVKSDPSAVVTLNGAIIDKTLFTNNMYYDFESQATNLVESDKPIQLVQYAVSQNRKINTTINPGFFESSGDPEMIYLNPIEQTLTNITMYSPPKFQIVDHYINVVIQTTGVAGMKLDGSLIGAQFIAVPGLAGYSYAQITVSSGTHNLTATEGFNAIAYGFGGAESYGYAAGANLKSLSIEAVSKITKQTVTSGCVNEAFNFSIAFAYKPSKLSWNLGDGSPLIDDFSPTVVSSFDKDGKTYYLYKLNQDISYSVAKDYTLEVTATNSSGDCGSTESISTEFSVYNPAVAKFSTALEICLDNKAVFKDESNGAGAAIKSWKWDFGDGQTSTDQNPSHLYAAYGSYKVTLTIENETACAPTVTSQTLIVYRRPVASFTQHTASCEPPVLTLTSTSTSADGVIVKWIWDFGDNTTEERTTETAFNHTFPKDGTYTVRLKVVTDKGCESDVLARSVILYPSPAANVLLPEVCLKDAFAQFTDQSTISDGSEAEFTYLWDFGDAAKSTPTNPNTSTEKDPKHKYTVAGNYTLKLIVTSNNGCADVYTKEFTVNGAVPVAEFEVLDPTRLCSNKAVVFLDKSSVDIGVVTKLEWYFGDSPDPVIFDDLSPNKLYTHSYALFSSPAKKTFNVIQKAYSGGTCVSAVQHPITVQAVPQVEFTALNNVCLEISPFQITQAKEIHGFTGTGVYSGTGITPAGMFNPASAGIGTHTIKYVFTAYNGCADSTIQKITVMPTPFANAGRDTLILQGGQTKLKGRASGQNLTYKWLPSTGLSQDNILDPVATPADDITYTLTVTSDQGCTMSDNIFIKVLKSPEIPNTFTPNGDGINDTWEIKYLDSYPGCTISIFNRLGNRIFNTVGYSKPWTGKFNGSDLPMGTYYYIVNPKNGQKTFTGAITIIR